MNKKYTPLLIEWFSFLELPSQKFTLNLDTFNNLDRTNKY